MEQWSRHQYPALIIGQFDLKKAWLWGGFRIARFQSLDAFERAHCRLFFLNRQFTSSNNDCRISQSLIFYVVQQKGQIVTERSGFFQHSCLKRSFFSTPRFNQSETWAEPYRKVLICFLTHDQWMTSDRHLCLSSYWLHYNSLKHCFMINYSLFFKSTDLISNCKSADVNTTLGYISRANRDTCSILLCFSSHHSPVLLWLLFFLNLLFLVFILPKRLIIISMRTIICTGRHIFFLFIDKSDSPIHIY